MATDAISMLKEDHRTVERLFKRFEKAGDRAHTERRRVVDQIIEALSVHAAIEEQLFYPVARATVPGTEDIALESIEEHHIVKWVLSELERMKPQDERFEPKVTVLIENVRHHVEEEEGEFFPKVRSALDRRSLQELGDAMVAAKKFAPTHPHPRSPDTPPGNLVVGAAAGVADRLGDRVSGLAQGGAAAAADLIATVLGRKKPAKAATGSRTARRTARGVRKGAADATNRAAKATRKAKRAGKRATDADDQDGEEDGHNGAVGRRSHGASGCAGCVEHGARGQVRCEGHGDVGAHVDQASDHHGQAGRHHHGPHRPQGRQEHGQDDAEDSARKTAKTANRSARAR